ncbi:MAG TPA: AAA family ATPase, partial [Acidimicrobiales bacterium]|nr:AAA family ATPase [Acidimicrobiales bacterium]
MLERLDQELVGLEPVKSRIREIGDLLLVDRLRRRFGVASTRPTLHMSFTGSPGTGKTTVALRMAELLHRLGYLAKGHLVSVTRDDLVGQYIGHTAPKTKEVLKRAMGGLLFVDEAYYLYRQENERDYGQETIEILLQVMENNREDLVVILAGYKDRMDQFFQSNPGMGSRIAHHIHFPDYTLDELMAIANLMLAEQQYELSEEAEAGVPRLPGAAHAATTVRQRPQRAQCPGARPPASGHPHRLAWREALEGRPHVPRDGGHPEEPGLLRHRGRGRHRGRAARRAAGPRGAAAAAGHGLSTTPPR